MNYDVLNITPLPRRKKVFHSMALTAARVSGGALKLHPAGSGRSPAVKHILVHLWMKIKCLALMFFNNLLLENVK